MKTITIIILCSVFACWLLWRIVSIQLVKKARAKLATANLAGFKKELGIYFRYKKYLDGSMRCKWSKGWITIRAEFDENGNVKQDKLLIETFAALPFFQDFATGV